MVLVRRKGPYSQRLRRRQPLLLTKTTFREVIAPLKSNSEDTASGRNLICNLDKLNSISLTLVSLSFAKCFKFSRQTIFSGY